MVLLNFIFETLSILLIKRIKYIESKGLSGQKLLKKQFHYFLDNWIVDWISCFY
jgi:hypothetical protein